MGNLGLGWMIKKERPLVWWHSGGTGGFASYATFCRHPAVAVVVLSNKSREVDQGRVDRLGDELLRLLIEAGQPDAKK